MKYKDKVRKLFSIFLAFSLIITMFNGLITNNRVARAEDVVRDISTVNKDTQVYQEGCDLVIKTTQQTEWSVPRKPIDLVILQDASGSFKDTIGGVKEALKTLTTPVEANQYDPDSPRLVFTDKAETSDRVMVASYQGLDGYRVYDDSSTELTDMWWDRTYGSWINGYRSDTNFQGTWRPGQWAGSPGYTLNTSELTSDTSKINNFIDSINTYGGTPTVPAIEDFIKKYKEAVDKTTEKMNNERKTVFLLITDGVANGVRLEDGKVVIQYSGKRAVTLLNKWGLGSIYLYPESSSNILARANELKSEGEKLRQAVGDNGSVVVGFWEDVKGFQNYAQYGTTYLEGFKDTGVDIGDNRSVQAIFSEALRSVASPDKEVNGKPATFYVNEQNDIKAFADKVLAAVGNALVKENVKGDFTITEGYKVKTVSINGKQIVKEVTDKEKQIRGEVTQEGNKVTISVPDAAFNPGHNKFDYELVRTEGAPESGDEEDEQTPPDGYTPGTVEREVGQLVGRFSVGNYQTAEIGSREANKVQVNSLEYCYPNAVKTITDKNKDNDQGSIKDPILTKRDSYAANLDNVQEEFSYKVDYRMNNIPLNMEKNAMLVDPVNYRLEVLDAYVTDTLTGEKLTNFEIRKVKDTDPQTNKERTIVVADIPTLPGVNTETVKEGQYGGHKFKRYSLHVKVKFKDEYPFDVDQREYIKILQENDGLGPLNQAFIKWNGESNDPNDPKAQVRRSNNVFVVPPVETNIEKKVRGENQNVEEGKEHYDLPLRDDKFIYDVKSAWPGLMDSYVLEDTLKDELEVVQNSENKPDVKIMVNGKDVPDLQNYLKVEGNTVKLELTKNDITQRLNRTINRLNNGNNGPALIHMQIKAKIKEGADLTKYVDNSGAIKVPNKAKVTLNDQPKESKEVTVTPDEPSVSKKINDTLEHLDIPSWDKNAYNYNIKTTLPSNIKDYGRYEIKDVLDSRLELQEGQRPSIKGYGSDDFDVSYDKDSNTIVAKIKEGHFDKLKGKAVVELVIPAKIKDGVTDQKIPNDTLVIYNKKDETGDPKVTPKTPPVTVTPPPSTPTKKINETLDELNIATKEENAYNYNIKTKLPGNIEEYKVFGIKDVLDERIELQTGKEAYIKGANAKHFEVKYDETSRTVTAKVKEESFDKLKGGEEVELIIPAKIKDEVTDSRIPNQATVIYNNSESGGEPKETPKTPPVHVTPPPTTPDITKKVNDKEHDQLGNVEDEFTYKIETKVPKNATALKITDELEKVLEFSGEVKVTVDNQEVGATVTKDNQLLTVELPEEVVKQKSEKEVKVEFKAKIKKGADLSSYVDKEDGRTKVPNKAKYQINNNPKIEKETPPVTVTPPPTTPDITKKVNEKEHVDLNKVDEEFTYKIETKVPENATDFEITDTIKDVLEFRGEVKATVDGEKIEEVKTEGKKLTVKLTREQVKQKAGKAVVVEFKAKLKDGVTQDELKPYISEKTKTVQVPNTAEYRINLSDDPKLKKETPPVTVTPPPSTPDITKKVNNQENVDLGEQNEEVTYTIETKVPENATAFVITDNLDPVLKFEGKAKATVDGEELSESQITIKDQLLTVSLTEEQAAKAGKEVRVEFKAKIKDGANLSKYIEEGTIKVPNKAKYQINNKPEFEKDSNKVHITPPPTNTTIEKKVEGKYHQDLEEETKGFTYTIETKVPANATSFEVTDTLEEVLTFDGEIKATLDGKEIKAEQITKDEAAGKVKVKLTQEEAIGSAGKKVYVEFKAKIKDGANLSKYIEEGTIKVPNKAKYKVNNNPEKDSNTVTVTPPPTNPEIKKTVNDKEHDQLGNVEDEFTYKIETKVPKNATALKITDELEKVLEFSGEVKATVDGKETKGEIKKEGQKLTVELTQEEITNNAEKEVKIEFKAKIKKDADLSSYVDSKDGRTKVPNKAKYQINNNPKIEKETPPVTVTPPPTTPEITKKVNEKEHVDLNKVDEEFTYKIETTVPENATDFEITDTIKDVLEFRGEVKATVDGEKIEEVKTEGKKLTVKLSREQVEQKVGKAVVVEFKAKLKEGVTQEELNAYLTKEEVRVPNTAEYRINLSDDPKLRKETPPVTVTPPPTTPEIEKTVNDKQEETLGSLSEEFTYKIKTKVPYNATKFKVEDEIKDVLEFSGEVSATVDGEKITDVTKQGQKLEVNLSEEQVKQKAGKEVYVEFKAKIKEGANLTQYIEEGTIKVPNVAKYIINDNPNNQKESNIVPVTPPPTTPPIDKKVNGKDKEILGERNQVVTYTIETKVPAAATYFEVEDTLEKVLEFTRGEKAKATLDGKELPESQVEIRGKTIKLKLTQEQVVEKTGKEVKLEFKANIEAGADLSPYIKEGKTSVPNKASYEINHEPKLRKESNIVPIEPPTRPTQPPITKEVNGKEKEELGRLDEEFTYTIRTTVPKNATEFKVTDALEKVLEFRGEVKATVDGKEVGKEQIHINGQNLEVELTREQVLQNGEKEVKVEFRAKIKDGADLTRYLVETKPSIPNKAQYIINNNPEFIKDSNIVPVTPPTPEPPKPGEKTINSENGEEQETIRQLKVGEEVFRYDIKAKLEENSYYKQFSIEDKLEEVLEARKATIRISGEQIEEDKELVELKELKEREKEIETKLGQTKANEAEGKQKELAKAEENLKELKEELGKQEEKETKEAKELEEKIAELKAGTKELASKEKEELEKELEKLKEEIRKEEETEKVKAIREINKALRSRNEKGEISEEEANKLGKLEKEGNKVRYEITNPQILRQLEGREIRLSIYAQIRNGADISKYNLKRVPNKATIEFDHKPKETNEVYVVPPVPPVTPPVVPPKPPVVPPTPEVPAKPKEEPKKPTEPKKELPKTGEGPVEGRWIGVIGLAIVGLIGRRRRREK